MERELESKLDAIMAKPGVVGVACVDRRGLCVSAKGVGVTYDTGVISSLADHARKLDPTSSASPIIRLESDHGYCLVQKREEFALAIFKKYNS